MSSTGVRQKEVEEYQRDRERHRDRRKREDLKNKVQR